MTRHFSADELDYLRRLRATFVAFEDRHGEAAAYWESAEELALYEETFAQRIGWKWDAVLDELVRRARLPGGASVLDWGCGTAIAARRYLAARAASGAGKGVQRVHLWDHAPEAVAFARERLREEYPGVELPETRPGELPEDLDVLLVSHVLDELGEEELAALGAAIERAAAVIWVEPGSRGTSRRLGEQRERHLATHRVLAPCTHQAACGVLALGASWCHSFARPPRKVFTEGLWSEFGRELGIDLRSLPYSFLALARRGASPLAEDGPGPGARLLGRPYLTRGKAEFELCDASGVASVDFLQRTDKALYKSFDDWAGSSPLFDAEVEGKRATKLVRRDA
jgi:SAM-dependent methyltransferase